MRPIAVKCAFIGFLLVVTGCTTLLQGSGTPQGSETIRGDATIADAKVQSDVLQMIGLYESAAGGSSQPKLISTERVGLDGPTFIEHWVVERNSKTVTYQVKLTPSPKGGVDFGIHRFSSP